MAFGGACVVRSLDHVDQELRRGVVVDVGGFENDAGDRAAGQTAGVDFIRFVAESAAFARNPDVRYLHRDLSGFRSGEKEGRKDRRIGLTHLISARSRCVEISHRRHAPRQLVYSGSAVVHISERIDSFGKGLRLRREERLNGMGRRFERECVDGRRLVLEQDAEFRHAPLGPQRHCRHAGRVEIAAFGHREVGDGNENLAGQLPVAAVHPVCRNRIGNQRRREQCIVGVVGDHFSGDKLRIPVARLPVDRGNDPVIAGPQFAAERARRQGVREFQFGPRTRIGIQQNGLRRVHDPACSGLFQDQQAAGVAEPLLVGGGPRHGFERCVRVGGFQPEADFDTWLFVRRRSSCGGGVRTPARQQRRTYHQEWKFFHNRTIFRFTASRNSFRHLLRPERR